MILMYTEISLSLSFLAPLFLSLTCTHDACMAQSSQRRGHSPDDRWLPWKLCEPLSAPGGKGNN